MQNQNQHWIDRDLKVLWHPCTQMKDHETLPLIPIRSGQGVYVEDFNGKKYLDAVSSWWVNLFGHCHPFINERIQHQLNQIEHVIFAGFTHPPAIELAEKLVQITPPGLNRCFFADNGSSGIEVALKMSFHYWHNQAQPKKTKFITLTGSYHGETLGALSVGHVELYKEIYHPLLMNVITVPSPDCYHRESGESWEAYSRRAFEAMEKTLEDHHEEVCAVIIEPLVQCAGGMRMYHPIYLQLLREACSRYQVHLIADEMAVGFGRTGTMFGCNQANITPDFLCLAKGLTGGYLSLAVILSNEHIYSSFYDEYHTLKAFLHSHSYTGNPLACAAACATLELFEKKRVLDHNQQLIKIMHESTLDLHDHPHVAEVRQTGMILAIEMIQNKKKKIAYPWQERRGLKVYEYALSNGILLRPVGNVIYFMPPYIITPQQIDTLAQVAREGIDLATK